MKSFTTKNGIGRALVWASFACLLGLLGCSGVEKIDQETDCRDICARQADCFDRDYDVNGCQKRCVDRADESEDVARDVESCDSCLDAKSCADAADCETDCASIIP